jgi:hypothetical protein
MPQVQRTLSCFTSAWDASLTKLSRGTDSKDEATEEAAHQEEDTTTFLDGVVG